jgi:DNA-binding LacI/PurR family transcriptional regulator
MANQKLPTIQDVAGALGMHKSTVSLALSGKGNLSAATRNRIVAAAREMGYQPNPLAQRLAQGHRNATVSIFSGSLDVGLATQKILLIQKELARYALEVPIYTAPETTLDAVTSQVTAIRHICKQRPRAIACFTHGLTDGVFDELERYQREGGIVVCYDHPAPLACDQVIFDREDNAYQAARYLIEKGHRDVGLRTIRRTEPTTHPVREPQILRLAGFQRALQEADLPLRDEWIFRIPTYETGGVELAQKFLALRHRPTGLCIINDYVALAFMAEVMEAGCRVPQDISVVGHDNQPIASYCPVRLTSVSHPVTRIAEAVVTMLLARLSGDVSTSPRTEVIRGELFERASVASHSPA